MESVLHENEIELRALFNSYDQNKDGVISAQELKDAFDKLGQHVTDSVIAEMMSQADTDNNGEIDFDEFMKMMKNFEMA